LIDQLVSTFKPRFWLIARFDGNQQFFRITDGEVLPGEFAPKQKLLVRSKVLVAAHIELVRVTAVINIGLVVSYAVVGVGRGISDVRIGVELLQGIQCDLAQRATGNGCAIAAARCRDPSGRVNPVAVYFEKSPCFISVLGTTSLMVVCAGWRQPS
jgi:hypothetical protein